MRPDRLSDNLGATTHDSGVEHSGRQQPGRDSHPPPPNPGDHIGDPRIGGGHVPDPHSPQQRPGPPDIGQRPLIGRPGCGKHNGIPSTKPGLSQPISNRGNGIHPEWPGHDHPGTPPDLLGDVNPNVIPSRQEHRHHDTRRVDNSPNRRLENVRVPHHNRNVHSGPDRGGDLLTHSNPARRTGSVKRQNKFHAGSIASR
ncbi:hypothetical protein SAMN05216553_11120 [Lentzea fradiae]|uniref:Uncharacterized protein n=1 Tax=Lentzea fradiae TaxID=200378 RepID=A0A1G7WS71_9PSEU|nr:hypothetical protein SAMN05216553_11120 [Lentzea fradiae]